MEADLYSACIHEAAHAAVAQHLGVFAIAEVFPSGTSDLVNEKIWVGQTRLYTPVTGRARVFVGLAGSVAEALDKDPEGFWANPCDFEYAYDLSPTDAALVGDLKTDDVETVGLLLEFLWPTVEREAGYLAAKVRS